MLIAVQVTIVFDEPMDQGKTEAAFSMVDAHGAAVSGTFEWAQEPVNARDLLIFYLDTPLLVG